MKTLREVINSNFGMYNQTFGIIMGLCGFIIMFSLINLINTLITNIMSRKKELAMLQSIGMTDKQLKKMIVLEGLRMVIWNVLITTVIGVSAGYVLVSTMYDFGIRYMKWEFPTLYLLLYSLLVLCLSITISCLSIKSIRNKSIVERLREND